MEASLVDFVKFSSSWMVMLMFGIFMLMLVLAFVPGQGVESLGKFLGVGGKNWFAWFLLGAVVVLFVTSSAYVFNWVLSWDLIGSWVDTEWFGMILLLAIAGVVAWKIK